MAQRREIGRRGEDREEDAREKGINRRERV
jgi:hypothetical protein